MVLAIVVFYFLIEEVTGALNIFYKGTAVVLTICMGFTIVFLEYERKDLSFVGYLIFISIFLLWRKKAQENINFTFYLDKWFKLLFKDRIVFINVIGNFILFIPLAFYINNRFSLLMIIAMILLYEGLQFLTKRGVFDIVDIVLNISGAFAGKGAQFLMVRIQKQKLKKGGSSVS